MVSGRQGCVMRLSSFPRGEAHVSLASENWVSRNFQCLCELWAFFLAWAGLLKQYSPDGRIPLL